MGKIEINNEYYFVDGVEDVCRLVAENMGQDTADYIRHEIGDNECKGSKCPSVRELEGINDSYHADLLDIRESLENILAELQKPRINKAELKKKLRQVLLQTENAI